MDEQFWSMVRRDDDGCWRWCGSAVRTHGNAYGMFYADSSSYLAHRYSYALAHGAIPPGLVIDHLCRDGLCVRPDHLEAVENTENILRGNGAPAQNARKTHCYAGHPFSPENTHISPQGRRICRTCQRLRWSKIRSGGRREG